MAKSHKTCMEQAEIIDTFGTYHRARLLRSPGASCSRVVLVRPWVVCTFGCVHRSPGILPRRRRSRAPTRGRPFTPWGDGLLLEGWILHALLLIGHNPLHGVMKLVLDYEVIELGICKAVSVLARKNKQEWCRN